MWRGYNFNINIYVTGVEWLDRVLCHLWHGQGPYWAFVGMSVWNLVSIALDRHCLVCRPFKYIQVTQRDWYKHLLAYVGFGLFTLSGGVLQVTIYCRKQCL